jgi:zinc D-Ala-D-Ala carboxypeptidase
MNIPDQRLSPHFMLSEFVRSQTADRQGIDNTPTPEIIERLRNNASNLEATRDLLQAPMHISSGYRCRALNRAIGSKDTSAHVDGRATDFEAPQFGTPLEVCRAIEASDIQFDQLIWEHTWTHIGWAREGETPRRQVLTLMPGGMYATGLVEVKAAA